jgi:uncharacterized membrane protein
VQDALPSYAAQCPIHPPTPARAVCARCGTFVCEWCTEHGQHAACLACRERGGFDFRFTRDAWTVSQLARHAWTTFKRDWGTHVVALVILGAVFMLFGAALGFGQIAFLGVQAAQTPFALKSVLFSSAVALVMNLLATPLLVGYIELCLTSLRGRPVHLGTLFVPYGRFATVATLVVGYSALALVYNLTLSFFFADQTAQQFYAEAWVWFLLGAPLFCYVGTGLGFTYAVLADDPKVGALEAVTRSWRMAAGKRWSILGVWMVCGFAIVLGAMMCLVPSIVVTPWASLLWAGSYLALATPTRSGQ